MKKSMKALLCASLVLAMMLTAAVVSFAADLMVFDDKFDKEPEIKYVDQKEKNNYEAWTYNYDIGSFIGFNVKPKFANGSVEFTNPAKTKGYFAFHASGALPLSAYIFSADVQFVSMEGPYIKLVYLRDETSRQNFPGFVVEKKTGQLYNILGYPQTVVYDENVFEECKNGGFINLAVRYDFKKSVYELYVNGEKVYDDVLAGTYKDAFSNGAVKPSFRFAEYTADKDGVNTIRIKNAKVLKSENPYSVEIDGKLWYDGELCNGTVDGKVYENGIYVRDEEATTTEEVTTSAEQTTAPEGTAEEDVTTTADASTTVADTTGDKTGDEEKNSLLPVLIAAGAVVVIAVVVCIVVASKKKK